MDIPVKYAAEKGHRIPVYVGILYPLNSMQVGESFEFPEDKRRSVASRASRIAKKTGRQYTLRKTGNGTIRCWRIK